MNVYVLLFQVQPLEGCTLDPAEIAVAMTRCYVVAESEKDAINRLKTVLIEEHFKLLRIEWCVNYDEVEWEKPDDPTAKRLIAEAKSTGDLVFGEFHVCGHDAPDLCEGWDEPTV